MDDFFKFKIEEVKNLQSSENAYNILDKLISKCAGNVVEGVENQLQKVTYFKKGVNQEVQEKMKHTPLTNSGCESRAAQLGVMTDFVWGSTSIETLSNKQIVKVNGYLKTSDFTTDEQTSHLFKWARTSSECKKVKEINQEFNARVNLTKTASLQAKEQLKKKKAASVIKLVQQCNIYGEPINENNIDNLLDSYNFSQLVNEVSLIKATVGKEGKLRKKHTDPITQKITYQKLHIDILKTSIRNVVKLELSSFLLDDILSKILIWLYAPVKIVIIIINIQSFIIMLDSHWIVQILVS